MTARDRARRGQMTVETSPEGSGAFLTAQEVARLLRLHVKRVQMLARSGQLPTVRVGRRWLFPRAQLLGFLRGTPADAVEAGVAISARNRLRGRITSMTVDGVMAEVRIQVGDQELVSIITRASAEQMRLRVGDPVVAVIKSTEVMVGKTLPPARDAQPSVRMGVGATRTAGRRKSQRSGRRAGG